MVPSSLGPNLNCFMRGQQADQSLLLPGGQGARARGSPGSPVLWHSRAGVILPPVVGRQRARWLKWTCSSVGCGAGLPAPPLLLPCLSTRPASPGATGSLCELSRCCYCAGL